MTKARFAVVVMVAVQKKIAVVVTIAVLTGKTVVVVDVAAKEQFAVVEQIAVTLVVKLPVVILLLELANQFVAKSSIMQETVQTLIFLVLVEMVVVVESMLMGFPNNVVEAPAVVATM